MIGHELVAVVSDLVVGGEGKQCMRCRKIWPTAEIAMQSWCEALDAGARMRSEHIARTYEPDFFAAASRFESALLEVSPMAREDLPAQTPLRWGRAMRELLSGYRDEPTLTTFDAPQYDQMVVVRDIPFASLCAHHVLPFTGVVSVGYLPTKRIIGLSKIPRIVRMYSRRLQVQEKLTKEIADKLSEVVQPRGVAVLVEATHTCMTLRGVEGDGRMVTSVMEGVFREKAEVRAEFFSMIGRR